MTLQVLEDVISDDSSYYANGNLRLPYVARIFMEMKDTIRSLEGNGGTSGEYCELLRAYKEVLERDRIKDDPNCCVLHDMLQNRLDQMEARLRASASQDGKGKAPLRAALPFVFDKFVIVRCGVPRSKDNAGPSKRARCDSGASGGSKSDGRPQRKKGRGPSRVTSDGFIPEVRRLSVDETEGQGGNSFEGALAEFVDVKMNILGTIEGDGGGETDNVQDTTADATVNAAATATDRDLNDEDENEEESDGEPGHDADADVEGQGSDDSPLVASAARRAIAHVKILTHELDCLKAKENVVYDAFEELQTCVSRCLQNRQRTYKKNYVRVQKLMNLQKFEAVAEAVTAAELGTDFSSVVFYLWNVFQNTIERQERILQLMNGFGDVVLPDKSTFPAQAATAFAERVAFRSLCDVTERAGVTWGTRPEEACDNRALKETRFEWVDPLPERLRTGIVADRQVPLKRVGVFLWPKYGSEVPYFSTIQTFREERLGLTRCGHREVKATEPYTSERDRISSLVIARGPSANTPFLFRARVVLV
ncbi:predicted protein [Postia placenta Mad-698-R]|uniref:Uncharacterized protein n=1 Tax=Postia placenta MAD-698-R-SB12 TaxID=670580 RepID=A0A1X6MXB9_9APHY|nr:hypothetical protein POSPLADRAFT_1047196 [Postia placenta MAD-698-R-SB12]EED84996.1 predicted protein [Postia placenta Mad-698-R]OSX60863.1 hypothetical protein POSPLADRAFT_1047196 [Postia placenta MAD-698-R-SB12]